MNTEDMRLETVPPAGSNDELKFDSIQVVGANTHNLKNISVQIPRDQLVVITGRSGSGKSSLAVDTIFAEGQRQYMESLSLFSRQFFKQLPYADVERIVGLPPTLCLDQKHGVTNRRSTVGTITEIYDYLRLLMARVGKIHCWQCGETIVQHTPQQIRDRLLELPERTKIMVMAPMSIDGSADLQPVLKHIRRERLVRVRIDGEILDIDQVPEHKRQSKATIDAITDRIIIREGVASRLLEAIEFADRLSRGRVIVCSQVPNGSTNDWSEEDFGTEYACQRCGIQFEEIQPRSFSFNGPQGACSECHGLGVIAEFDPRLVITDLQKSLAENIVAPWRDLSPGRLKRQLAQLDPILNHLQFDREQPLARMAEKDWHEFLRCGEKSHPGLLVVLEKELATTLDVDREEELLRFKSTMTCHGCDGSRLNKTALSVFLSGLHIGQVVDLSIEDSISYFEHLELDDEQRQIAVPITEEILHRLRFLQKVGVGYLTLGRGANTLSGGEHQRVRLATSIGSGLTNVCYVLDEPSIGLHQRDNDRLISSIQDLRQAGNSIILIEHDEATIREADHIIDLGPGVGMEGGKVVAAGSPDEICQAPNSLTGDYLAGRRKITTPKNRRPANMAHKLTVTKASGRNLKSINIQVPLGILVCVTGVSGSGKSTLINHTMAPALLEALDRVAPTPQPFGSISGCEQIDQLVLIDQKPIGRNPRGCPATVTGLINDLRKVFAATKQAKQLGFGASRFSFNTKAGWCPECKGHGIKKLEMNFLPDFFVTCESCRGRRYNLQTLQIKFNGMSIADVLDMSVDTARDFFDGIEVIKRPLQSLIDVGLGYLRLGQSTTTLSGGEAQRVKLATELSKNDVGRTLYILDEPTTGLHFEDIRVLLLAMNRLVDQGNSMIVIEHNLDVIRSADWIIDLGPEGGEGGGELIAAGTPEEVAGVSGSLTGRYLKDCL